MSPNGNVVYAKFKHVSEFILPKKNLQNRQLQILKLIYLKKQA